MMIGMSEPVSFHDGRVMLHGGDCLEVLKAMPEASVDSVVTDPPYGLKFMGRAWDAADNIAFRPELWAEVLRVLKPGGFVLAMGGDRTVHRLACAIEDAGFELRGQIAWVFAVGFPKSLNVGRTLASLPWCSCRGCKKTGSAAKSPVPPHKRRSASDANSGLASRVASGSEGADIGVNAIPPLQSSGTGVRTASSSVLFDGASTKQAQGLGDEPGSCPRHRQPGVNGGVENIVRNLDPIVFGTPNVAVVTEGSEIAFDVGRVELEPISLRDEMVSNQVGCGPTVSTGAVPSDDGRGNIFPSSPLVGPLSASPSVVSRSAVTVSIASGHTEPGTIDGIGLPGSDEAAELTTAGDALESGSTAFEFGAAASSEDDGLIGGGAFLRTKFSSVETPEELDAAMLAGFGGHENSIRSLVAENKVSVCGECKRPRRPEWIDSGLGTALKPAMELVVMARKPLSESTVAGNVLRHGTGAINVDACRIGIEVGERDVIDHRSGSGRSTEGWGHLGNRADGETYKSHSLGRWPANVCTDGSPEVLAGFPETDGVVGALHDRNGTLGYHGGAAGSFRAGTKDSGSAARFYYTAKADADDRLGSKHPTVKPLDLMQWLVRLVTPPNGTVLDCFAGTGTTGEAAFREGFHAILIEREAEYQADIARRMKYALGGPDERRHIIVKSKGKVESAGPLFEDSHATKTSVSP